MNRISLTVEGMSCQNCVKALTRTLSGVQGVEQLEVEVGRARFLLPHPADRDAFNALVDEAGFDLVQVESTEA